MVHKLVASVHGAASEGTKGKEVRSLQQAKNLPSHKCRCARRSSMVAHPNIPH